MYGWLTLSDLVLQAFGAKQLDAKKIGQICFPCKNKPCALFFGAKKRWFQQLYVCLGIGSIKFGRKISRTKFLVGNAFYDKQK